MGKDVPHYMATTTFFYQKRDDILDVLFPEGGRTPLIRKLDGPLASIAPYGLDLFDFCIYNCRYCFFAKKNHFVHTKKNSEREKIYQLVFPKEVSDELEQHEFTQQVLIGPYSDPFACTGTRKRRWVRVADMFIKHNVPMVFMTKGGMFATNPGFIARMRGQSQVGSTIITYDHELSKYLEGDAPSPMDRIASVKKLHREGVKTFVAFLPFLSSYDVLRTIEKTADSADWYFLGAYEGDDMFRDALGIIEPLEASLSIVVERLRDMGKRFLVDEGLAKKCPNVQLNEEELEKTYFWQFTNRS